MTASPHDMLRLLDHDVGFGETTILPLSLPSVSQHLPATVPVMVIRGPKPGPRVCITGAIHGDEVIGVDIISRLLDSGALQSLTMGDVILVPVINIFGFIQRIRYLPDRRDLNRSFPGSNHGSLASRVAHLLLNEVVGKCSHLIDLHSGAVHRFNLPHLRVARTDERSFELARTFAPPLILRTESPAGSLRHLAVQRGLCSLVFEGSEAERFDEAAGEVGRRGILRVLQSLGMLGGVSESPGEEPYIASSSKWFYAPEGGIYRSTLDVGERVQAGDVVGSISDMFGRNRLPLIADTEGIVIGQSKIPVIHEGDALFHIAQHDPLPEPVPVDVNPPPTQ